MYSKIEFKIKKILYPKNEILELGGYSIIACELVREIEGDPIIVNNKYNNFSLLSYTPVIFNFYDTYTAEVQGEQTSYGTSYKLVKLEREEDELTEGEKNDFLEKVFTPIQYINLTKAFDNPYDLIANKKTEELLKVKGIGEKTVEYIYKKFEENLKYQKILTALSEYKLTRSIMENLLNHYGDPEVVIKKIKENVYILADEINGIGFIKADQIALSTGMSPRDLRRVKAFMKYYLFQEAQEGNSWVVPKILFSAIEPNLKIKITADELRECLYDLHNENVLWWNEEKTKLGLQYFYNLEQEIYNNIKRISDTPHKSYTRDKIYEEKIIKNCEKECGYEFTEEQLEAVNGILDNNISLLVGSAGTGKSSLIKVIASIYKEKGYSSCLCTLSGKAAARIEEATGFKGSTIHRALGYNPQFSKFMNNEDNPLPHQIVIVDETSFVGGELFLSLLKAIQNGSRLVLVGDDSQLPAIGACNIFFDMINSGRVKVNRLTKIHRQAQKSGIILASADVRKGIQITKNGWIGTETRGELQDFTIDVYEDRIVSRPKLLDYYKRYVKTLEDADKTQIILATKSKGDANTFDINNEIQDYLNPHSPYKNEILLKRNDKNFVLRVGDRVINRKNDYKATVYQDKKSLNLEDDSPLTSEIFNGFCGVVQKIENNKVIVKFDLVEPLIVFSYEKLKNLELAYALTVHLYQGSQVERVIYLIDNSSYIMNTKELIYTAITRATKHCILLAQREALRKAIITSQTINKQTFLKSFLIENA